MNDKTINNMSPSSEEVLFNISELLEKKTLHTDENTAIVNRFREHLKNLFFLLQMLTLLENEALLDEASFMAVIGRGELGSLSIQEVDNLKTVIEILKRNNLLNSKNICTLYLASEQTGTFHNEAKRLTDLSLLEAAGALNQKNFDLTFNNKSLNTFQFIQVLRYMHELDEEQKKQLLLNAKCRSSNEFFVKLNNKSDHNRLSFYNEVFPMNKDVPETPRVLMIDNPSSEKPAGAFAKVEKNIVTMDLEDKITFLNKINKEYIRIIGTKSNDSVSFFKRNTEYENKDLLQIQILKTKLVKIIETMNEKERHDQRVVSFVESSIDDKIPSLIDFHRSRFRLFSLGETKTRNKIDDLMGVTSKKLLKTMAKH